MDKDLIDQINELAEKYQKYPDKDLHDLIDQKLFMLDFQQQILRFKLKVIPKEINKSYVAEHCGYSDKFSDTNAFATHQLIIPLLLYLLEKHKSKLPAYETSLNFMKKLEPYLKEGDFYLHKTGSLRFITNTRFASDRLRDFGLIRSDMDTYYKIWELSFFGALVASIMYKTNFKAFSDPNFIKHSYIDNHFVDMILAHYFNSMNDTMILNDLFDFVLEEEEILKLKDNLNQKVKEFRNVALKYIGYNPNSRKTYGKDFLDFLHNSNNDKLMSKFNDAIVLRNELDVNMKTVMTILKKEQEH